MSSPVLPLTGTELSQNSGIPISEVVPNVKIVERMDIYVILENLNEENDKIRNSVISYLKEPKPKREKEKWEMQYVVFL